MLCGLKTVSWRFALVRPISFWPVRTLTCPKTEVGKKPNSKTPQATFTPVAATFKTVPSAKSYTNTRGIPAPPKDRRIARISRGSKDSSSFQTQSRIHLFKYYWAGTGTYPLSRKTASRFCPQSWLKKKAVRYWSSTATDVGTSVLPILGNSTI